MDNRSSAEIANEIANRENELSEALENHFKVEQERLLISKEIIDLQSKKKEFEIAESKSSHIIKKLKLEISLLTKRFWATKEQGL